MSYGLRYRTVLTFPVPPHRGCAAGVLTLISVVLSFVLSVARNGGSGIRIITSGLEVTLEIFSRSSGANLCVDQADVLEAIRRKALLVFVVFAILLMFAGVLLTDSNSRPELQFPSRHSAHCDRMVDSAGRDFPELLALPEDIRIRSLHTVVTKPARRIEIVIGRYGGYGNCGLPCAAV